MGALCRNRTVKKASYWFRNTVFLGHLRLEVKTGNLLINKVDGHGVDTDLISVQGNQFSISIG